jgi:hypothetical protein
MKYIWNQVDSLNLSEYFKLKMIVILSAAVSAAAGLCVWSLVQLWALDHWSWMIVFTGYPAFLAVVLVIIYSFNHSFHDGSYKG